MTETKTIVIEKLVQGGRGLARRDGQVLLVRGAIPGETVTVRPGKLHKGVQEGTVGDILVASPDRIAAPCPVYDICGGCQLQHLRYEAQLIHKAAILKETLARVGKLSLEEIPPVLPSPDPFGYRSTVRFTVFRQEGTGKAEEKGQGQSKSTDQSAGKSIGKSIGTGTGKSTGKSMGLSLGFHREGSHDPVSAAGCLLASEPMRKAAAMVNDRLARTARLSLRLETVELRASLSFGALLLIHHTGPASQGEAQQIFKLFEDIPGLVGQVVMAQNKKRWVEGQDWIADRLGGLIFRISDRSFMQANWRVAEAMSKTIGQWLAPLEGLRILELYAGIGILGLPLARAGALVTEVEANPSALADCRHAAKVNHIGRCRLRPLTAEAMLNDVQAGDYDLVMADPPRTGFSQDCLQQLARIGAGRLIYRSSDPATLARDLGRLCKEGYRIGRMQPFDMFPQTAHIETVVELVR